jgi:hypothetical protein
MALYVVCMKCIEVIMHLRGVTVLSPPHPGAPDDTAAGRPGVDTTHVAATMPRRKWLI